MSANPEKFAQLLTEGVHRVRLRENKSVQMVQDELGYALGREGGGSAVEYWRKGHIPPRLAEVEALARQLVPRGQMDRTWLEQFLRSAGHPAPEPLCRELYGGTAAAPPSPPTATAAAPAQLAPFVVGPPVMHPRQFFGREAELRRIFHVWQRHPLQHVALIGPKRSGKTSLLHYVRQICTTPPLQRRPDQRTDWLPQPEHFRWVYVDFQDSRMGNRSRLLRHILSALGLRAPDPCELDHFLDVMIEATPAPTVIMLDEISAALAAPELDLHFWWSLRSLGTNLTEGNLAFVLAGHGLPMQLAQEHGKPSPFFNIFGHVLRLGPLDLAATHALIASAPQPFPAADVAWIVEQSQGWPCLVQILCETRLIALEEGASAPSWQAEGLLRLEPYRYLLTP